MNALVRSPQLTHRLISQARIADSSSANAISVSSAYTTSCSTRIKGVTAVLLFAGCAHNKRCLHCRYEFANYLLTSSCYELLIVSSVRRDGASTIQIVRR